MRFIIYGVGAIGGTVAAALHRSGAEVMGIARGAQLEAIRQKGLTLRTPDGDFTVPLACVAHPSEIGFRPDDAVLLAMKSQHTPEALLALRAAGLVDQPVFCLQNGVANERAALRYFPNVHAVTVMMPATFLTPGEVVANGSPRHGIFDIGRWPAGTDADDTAFATALEAANIAAFVTPEVAASKYGKLLMNLGNICNAALGSNPDVEPIADRMRDEAKAVLAAAGIAWADVGAKDPRRETLMKVVDVPGAPRAGGSTFQSLVRGADSLETDYLNGEIALLGRLHGVTATANGRAGRVAERLVSEGRGPGAMTPDALRAALFG